MSYISCDMNCDKETNKSDLGKHCSDCTCINESTGGQQQELSATKAWRSTSVVEGRDHPNTLSEIVLIKVLEDLFKDSVFQKFADCHYV